MIHEGVWLFPIENNKVSRPFKQCHSLHGKAEHQAIAVLTTKRMPRWQALIFFFKSTSYASNYYI